jgi:hypothetical protein
LNDGVFDTQKVGKVGHEFGKLYYDDLVVDTKDVTCGG